MAKGKKLPAEKLTAISQFSYRAEQVRRADGVSMVVLVFETPFGATRFAFQPEHFADFCGRLEKLIPKPGKGKLSRLVSVLRSEK